METKDFASLKKLGDFIVPIFVPLVGSKLANDVVQNELTSFLVHILRNYLGNPKLEWTLTDIMLLLNTFKTDNSWQNISGNLQEEVTKVIDTLDMEETYNHPCNNTIIKPSLLDYCKNLKWIRPSQDYERQLMTEFRRPS